MEGKERSNATNEPKKLLQREPVNRYSIEELNSHRIEPHISVPVSYKKTSPTRGESTPSTIESHKSWRSIPKQQPIDIENQGAARQDLFNTPWPNNSKEQNFPRHQRNSQDIPENHEEEKSLQREPVNRYSIEDSKKPPAVIGQQPIDTDDQAAKPASSVDAQPSTSKIEPSETEPDLPDNTPCFIKSFQMSDGMIRVDLKNGYHLEITVDKAVRFTNSDSTMSIAISGDCNSFSFMDERGKVYQCPSSTEVFCFLGSELDPTNCKWRCGKFGNNAMHFKRANEATSHTLDADGHVTPGYAAYSEMSNNFTTAVFFDDSLYGDKYAKYAYKFFRQAKYQKNANNTQMFYVHDFRISQAKDGLVILKRYDLNATICLVPANRRITITTDNIYCSSTFGNKKHILVKSGDQKIFFDGLEFQVGLGKNIAGFKENDELFSRSSLD